MSTLGSRRPDVIRNRSIATGTSGRSGSRHTVIAAWCFLESRNQPGPTTASPRPGTFTAATISNPISIHPTPYVQAEVLKIMGFWLQLGVSGFRMDAVPFVIAKKGAEQRRPVEQYDMLRGFREFLQWR